MNGVVHPYCNSLPLQKSKSHYTHQAVLYQVYIYIYMKGPKQKAIISLEIVAYWFCMTRLFILYSYLAMRLRDCVQH